MLLGFRSGRVEFHGHSEDFERGFVAVPKAGSNEKAGATGGGRPGGRRAAVREGRLFQRSSLLKGARARQLSAAPDRNRLPLAGPFGQGLDGAKGLASTETFAFEGGKQFLQAGIHDGANGLL